MSEPIFSSELPTVGFEKRCSKCDGTGPFTRHKKAKDGLSTVCVVCNRAHVKAWRKANPKKRSAAAKRRRLRNPERVRMLGRAGTNRYRIKYPERYRASYRAWYKKKMETEASYFHSKGMKRRSAPGFCTPEQLRCRMDLYGNKCAYCPNGLFEHVEHVIPLAQGGTHWPANLRPSCAPCNYRKGTRSGWGEVVMFGEIVEGDGSNDFVRRDIPQFNDEAYFLERYQQ